MSLGGAKERVVAIQERVPVGSNREFAGRVGSVAGGNRLIGSVQHVSKSPEAVWRILRRGRGGRESPVRGSSREVQLHEQPAAGGVEHIPPRPPGSDSPRESGSGYPEERRVTQEILPPKPVILRFGEQSVIVIPEHVSDAHSEDQTAGIGLYSINQGRLLSGISDGYTIGRKDFGQPDLTVSRFHAQFRRSPDGWRVEDLDSHNGTYIQEIPQISPGDTEIPVPSGAWRHVRASSGITVHVGESAWATIEQVGIERFMRDESMDITPLLPCGTPKHFGRSRENDVQIGGSSVSRDHGVVIALEDGTTLIQDKGSTNGTRVSVTEEGQFSRYL